MVPLAHKIILLILDSALQTLQIEPPIKLFYGAVVELHVKQCICGGNANTPGKQITAGSHKFCANLL